MRQTIFFEDFYKHYKIHTPGTIGKPLYRKILKSFCLEFKKELFNNSIISIPGDLGKVFIKKSKLEFAFNEDGTINPKMSKASVDFYKTKQLWARRPDLIKKQYIYHTNEHTNGFRYKLKWVKPDRDPRSFKVIVLSAMRGFKRDFSKHIKKNFGIIDYYEELC